MSLTHITLYLLGSRLGAPQPGSKKSLKCFSFPTEEAGPQSRIFSRALSIWTGSVLHRLYCLLCSLCTFSTTCSFKNTIQLLPFIFATLKGVVPLVFSVHKVLQYFFFAAFLAAAFPQCANGSVCGRDS